jgi:hypothetical protein
MGLGEGLGRPVLRWMPSIDGYRQVNRALRELLGRMSGA